MARWRCVRYRRNDYTGEVEGQLQLKLALSFIIIP